MDTQNFMKGAKAASSGGNYIFIVALVVNQLLSFSDSASYYFFLMMRVMQLSIIRPIFRGINFPTNVMIALKNAVPIVFFDIMNNGFGINPTVLIPLDKAHILENSRHIPA